jgi:hypothetical protein
VRRKSIITILTLLLIIVACEKAPDETDIPISREPILVLPNFLVEATGEVKLRRPGWRDFLPVSIGTLLESGDLIRVSEDSHMSIFCGDETLWELNPTSLPADGIEHSIPCQSSYPPRPWSDVARVRGEDDDRIPYVIAPRNSALLDTQPMLRWHPLSGVDIYEVTILSDDGMDRTAVTATGHELGWPDAWPSLQPGASYVLIVEGDKHASDAGNTQHVGLAFWLLSPQQTEIVERLESRLRERPMQSAATTLLVAELYRNYDLRVAAADLLAALPPDDDTPIVWLTLGQVYLEMGLGSEARTSLIQALDISLPIDDLEMAAHAHMGLGMADQQMGEATAPDHWRAARLLYEQIGDANGLETVDELLGESTQ